MESLLIKFLSSSSSSSSSSSASLSSELEAPSSMDSVSRKGFHVGAGCFTVDESEGVSLFFGALGACFLYSSVVIYITERLLMSLRISVLMRAISSMSN